MVVEVQPSKANGNSTVSAKRYAVVVGVNDYSEASIGNSSYCAADAEAFYDALLTYCQYDPGSVVLFSDGAHRNAQKPLRSNILAAIADMSNRATEEDSVLFFFAGHGTRDTKDSYLLTQEFRTQVVADTSIPMDMINNYFRESKAKFIMRFFDACHSGRIGARAAPVGPDIRKHFLVEGKGWATLSACEEDQYAHEDPELGHGIFSYCLIKGLSGEAAISKQDVTLDSLISYTISNTIEITKDRGLEQTPVTGGFHAGNLVLASVHSIPTEQVPPALMKVEETTIEQLRPTPEKVPQFIADIRAILQNEPIKTEYIASSQQYKLDYGAMLVQKIFGWCQEQERRYHDQLDGLVTIDIKHQSIQACPLNPQLAQYIETSKIRQAVALKMIYKTVQVESKAPRFGGVALLMNNYETEEVLNGISERPGNYETAIKVTINSTDPTMPICAIVIAIIPASFGLYLLRYSCSSLLDQVQRELWDPATFSIRTLRALPITNTKQAQIPEDLQDFYPQLFSFFAESCAARKLYLQRIGVGGQSLL